MKNIAAFYENVCVWPGLKAEILSIGQQFNIYLYPLFLHKLGVLNSNLSNNIIYLVTFTFKLAKNKMAAMMVIKYRIFNSLSHMKAQFMVSGIFLFDKFISSVLGKK